MNDGMSRETVNDLQGKSKSSVDEAYFFNNDESLRSEYIMHLHAVTMSKEIEKVTIKSPEVRLMESQNQELNEENRLLKQNIDGIMERLNALENIRWEDIKNK